MPPDDFREQLVEAFEPILRCVWAEQWGDLRDATQEDRSDPFLKLARILAGKVEAVIEEFDA